MFAPLYSVLCVTGFLPIWHLRQKLLTAKLLPTGKWGTFRNRELPHRRLQANAKLLGAPPGLSGTQPCDPGTTVHGVFPYSYYEDPVLLLLLHIYS